MTLDIRGGLKNTNISSNRYVVLEELLSNAIDSYLIRKKSDAATPPLSIAFTLEFFHNSLVDDGYDLKLSCVDNGAGFGDEQVKAFVTKDSSYKDYLNIQGIGKCKGAGRIQFFHYFRQLKIDSVYTVDGKFRRRSLDVIENTREISEAHFKLIAQSSDKVETTITLQNLKQDELSGHSNYSSIKHDFSAKAVRNYLFIALLQKFIVLKGIIGDFSISITEIDGTHTETISIKSNDLPKHVDKQNIPIICTHGNRNKQITYDLMATRYSLPYNNFKESQHEVALCANSALVCSLIKKYLRTQDIHRPIEGNFELVLIESDFLEDKVNEQRDGFNIPKECDHSDDFKEGISMQDIVESLEDYVYRILTPKDFDKDALIDSTQERFGISRSMLDSVNIKVHYSDTEENIAKRVLKKYQEEIVKETSDIFDLKQELLGLDPRCQDFRDKISELSWKYTSTIKKMDMANLSQLVVRRSSMLEVLKCAVDSMLSCQNRDENKKENEKIIHNIFFPTGKDSIDSIDHDIWILNEEYHYFEHISSDKSLATIPWNKSENIFEIDIDSSLEDLFAKNNKDHRLKRPDIAIFNQEGAAIIIEFKAPGVELQDHIPDLGQYARLLAAKSKGRIKKIYGYLIGDCMDETRMPLNYTRFPSGLGYFNTAPIKDPSTNTQYGELYSEVLFYNQFIDRAVNRLKVYKKKLNMDI